MDGGEEANFLCRRIPNNLCRYGPLRQLVQGNAVSTLEVFTAHSNLIPKTTMWKGGGGSNLAVEKPEKQSLGQVIKVNAHSDIRLITIHS